MKPFSAQMNFANGLVTPFHNKTERKLSDIGSFFSDSAAVAKAIAGGDRIVYEAYEIRTPSESGELSWCTTIIYPGTVGGEFHMSKGHFHKKDDSTELYLGVKGTGCLICQTRDGQFESEEIGVGSVTLVPALWAHRIVNTGKENLIVMAVYASDAGHDYGFIEKKGFLKLVCEEDGRVVLRNNPRY